MATVYGNLRGIRASQIKQLEQLQAQRQPSDRWVTAEFAQALAHLSQIIQQPICCYLNRRGQVIRIGVGTPVETQLSSEQLPRQSGERLSGIRCIVAQPQTSKPALSATDTAIDHSIFTAMLRQRLDALVILMSAGSIDRSANGIDTAKQSESSTIPQTLLTHIIPDAIQPWTVETLPLSDLAQQDAIDLIDEWERALEEIGFDITQWQQSATDRVLLVGLQTDNLSNQLFRDSMMELEKLVESATGEVVGVMQQKRSQPHAQTVVGQGKVEEIALEAQRVRANLIVFNQDISAAQARNLEEQIGLRVVDRTEVILDIFAQRARSQAGKLQVELAQLEYLRPRLRGRGQAMSRLGAGIGTRGPGETKLETERRTIQRRITHLQQEVDQLQAQRARLRQQRERQVLPTIALVGYTNVGKSTLLNVLTQAEVYAADQLFATLDPTTRRLTLVEAETGSRHNLLLTDTVGFIHDLPPALMDAFRATLEEVTEADAMLHIVDLSHPAWQQQIESVESVLADLPATPPEELLVFNKVDLVDRQIQEQVQRDYPDAILISATVNLGLEILRQRLLQWLNVSSHIVNQSS